MLIGYSQGNDQSFHFICLLGNPALLYIEPREAFFYAKEDNMNFLKQRWGDTPEEGFTVLPNYLIDYHEKLGITLEELGLLLKILRHKDGFTIHDSMLSQTVSKKTIVDSRIIFVSLPTLFLSENCIENKKIPRYLCT